MKPMDVHSLCTLRASGFIWQPGPGTFAQTVIVKATFQLEPGQSTLAGDQEAINEDDNYWNDDPSRSIVAPSDWAPFKPKADIMLVGHAFAPGGIPTRALTARILIGEIDKSIEVWCDRGFRIADGQLLEGPRFSKMPLRWERTAGGPGTSNPVGMRFDAPPDKYGMVAVPNLQPLGMYVSKRSDTFAPVGYGPIAADWPNRMTKLGRLGAGFFARGWGSRPLPEGVDYAYFQAAPTDQQTGELRAAERLVLENLHPEHARLVTNLPGIKPRVIAERGNGAREEVGLMTDTLWIDTDRGLCTLVWRGRISLRDAAEPGRIVVSMEEEAPVSLELELEDELEPTKQPKGRAQAADLSAVTIVPGTSAQAMVAAALPFAGNARPSISEGEQRAAVGDSVLPFGRAEVPPPAPVAPPAIVMPRGPVESVATPSLVSPWARRENAVPDIGPAMAVAAVGITPPLNRSEDHQASVFSASHQAAEKTEWPAGRPSVSSAAAQPTPPTPQERPGPRLNELREALSLLWFDEQSVRRIRKHKPFREILEAAQKRPIDDDFEDTSGGELAEEIEDRRDIFEVLTSGTSVDAQGVTEALERNIREDGKLIYGLVFCAGEIVMTFDEVERLKATVTTVTPLSAGDENLKASLQIAKDFLALPNLSSAPSVAEGLVKRIQDTFASVKRAVPADYVEIQTERALLEQRHYQKRKVFGGKYLRGLLVLGGGKEGVPVYLPEGLGEELPMFVRFRVRLIAEVRTTEDQYETHPAALRVLALGRVVERRKQ